MGINTWWRRKIGFFRFCACLSPPATNKPWILWWKIRMWREAQTNSQRVILYLSYWNTFLRERIPPKAKKKSSKEVDKLTDVWPHGRIDRQMICLLLGLYTSQKKTILYNDTVLLSFAPLNHLVVLRSNTRAQVSSRTVEKNKEAICTETHQE